MQKIFSFIFLKTFRQRKAKTLSELNKLDRQLYNEWIQISGDKNAESQWIEKSHEYPVFSTLESLTLGVCTEISQEGILSMDIQHHFSANLGGESQLIILLGNLLEKWKLRENSGIAGFDIDNQLNYLKNKYIFGGIHCPSLMYSQGEKSWNYHRFDPLQEIFQQEEFPLNKEIQSSQILRNLTKDSFNSHKELSKLFYEDRKEEFEKRCKSEIRGTLEASAKILHLTTPS
jgi:hypothetical protein